MDQVTVRAAIIITILVTVKMAAAPYVCTQRAA